MRVSAIPLMYLWGALTCVIMGCAMPQVIIDISMEIVQGKHSEVGASAHMRNASIVDKAVDLVRDQVGDWRVLRGGDFGGWGEGGALRLHSAC